ncbi:MAG: hypothetical protein IPL75_12880 [Acidobacteria bacterium]|nr:hypothetical protein [Acidobacteriota bacterium]
MALLTAAAVARQNAENPMAAAARARHPSIVLLTTTRPAADEHRHWKSASS